MFKVIVAIIVLVAVCNAQPLRKVVGLAAVDERPEPYNFAYNNQDEFGTQWSRSEEGDANGVVRGTYGYRDATGLYRTVEYIADENGFRASVSSNEPGLISSAPAAVTYTVTK